MATLAKMTAVIDSDVIPLLRGIDRGVKSISNLTETTRTKAALIGSFFGNLGTQIATSLTRFAGQALRELVSTIGESISVAAEFQNTFIGLSTVTRAFGGDVAAAEQAALNLASDGLLRVDEAAAGLKNLLGAGFGLPEAIQLMEGFKDSAAFNRQATLGFGDAIVSATAGLKNQQSQLVDNAGLTKNLSVIMKEAGLSVSDLARVSGDAGVRAKFLSGLLAELNVFTGDAARLSDTYTGSVSRLSTSWTLTLKALGDAVATNQNVAAVVNLVADALQGGTAALLNNKTGTELVSGAVLLFTDALIELIRWVRFAADDLSAFTLQALALERVQIKTAIAIRSGLGLSVADLTARLKENLRETAQTSLTQETWQRTLANAESRLTTLRAQLQASSSATIAMGSTAATATAETDALGQSVGRLEALTGGVEAETRQFTKAVIPASQMLGALRTEIFANSTALGDVEAHTVSAAKWIRSLGQQELPIMTVAIEENTQSLDVWLRKMGNVGTVASQGAGFFGSIGNFFKGGFSQILKGGLQSIGSAIFQPITNLINSGINFLSNAIVDAFTNPVWEQAMEDIGTRWGVDISEALAKQIEADAKTIGDRVAAQLMNLSAIIQEAGGIEAFGLANATAAARDFFVMIETGQLTVAQAGAEFNKVFSDIAAHLDPNDPGAPFQQFIELIDLAHRFGLEIDNLDTILLDMIQTIDTGTDLGIARFTQLLRVAERAGVSIEQVSQSFADDFFSIVGNISGLLPPLAREIIGLMREMGIASEQIAELVEANWQRATDGLFRFIETASITTQEQAFATSSALTAAFNAAVAAGTPLAQVIAQFGPSIETLREKLAEAGLTGTRAFQQIRRFAAIMADDVKGPLVESVLALNDVLIGLSNTGALTQRQFAAFATSIAAALDKLKDNGVAVKDILVLAQPSLQTLWELSTDFGFVLDENTQKWVDMAVAAGLVGDAFRDPASLMTDALFGILEVLVEIARVFGAKIPEGIQAMLDAHNRAAEVMSAGIEIPIHYIPTGAGPGDFFDPNHPGMAVTITPTGLARGGLVGTDTVPAMLTPGEFVMSRQGVATAGVETLQAINRGQGVGPSVVVSPGAVVVNRPIFKQRRDMDELANEIAAAMTRQLRQQARVG